MTAHRVSEEQKLSVKCPICGAKPGMRCGYWKASTNVITAGVRMQPHPERREAYLQSRGLA